MNLWFLATNSPCKHFYGTLNCLGLKPLNPLSMPREVFNTSCILSDHKRGHAENQINCKFTA